jgi:hypothetical protein
VHRRQRTGEMRKRMRFNIQMPFRQFKQWSEVVIKAMIVTSRASPDTTRQPFSYKLHLQGS